MRGLRLRGESSSCRNRSPTLRNQPATGMVGGIAVRFRPVTADRRLGGRPVLAGQSMKRALQILIEIPTRGNHFALDDVVIGASHLAEVRRPAGSDQRLRFDL